MIESAQILPNATSFLPPPGVEEAAWDILLALHADRCCELRLAKLANLVSLSSPALRRQLELLEQRRLVAGVSPGFGREVRAILTSAGRRLLDQFLSAAADLRLGAHH